MAALQFILLLSFFVAASSATTLTVLHASLPTSSPADLLALDESRLLYLSSLAAPRRAFVPIASAQKLLQSPTYIVRARVGTPPQSLLAAIDTSSDLAWFPSTSFSPAKSTTFRPVSCESAACGHVPNRGCDAAVCTFNLTYGSSEIYAGLSSDSLSLASEVVPDYTFGSIRSLTGASAPPQGLLGLGRGLTSFVSQTQSIYGGVFSYCLPSFRSLNFSGTLRLGPAGQPIRIKTTPLLSNPHRPSLYYVKLIGIRVGRRILDIPTSALEFNGESGAGTVFDSGTMFTRLVAPAYVAVRDEFRRRVMGVVTSLGGFDTCYNGPIVAPTVTFMFDGMNVTLPADNVMIHSTAGSISCLAMAAAPDNVNSVLNVIASMQQQNHRVVFDVAHSRVGVSRETCTTP